jgi:hypothetical protein
MNAKGCAHMNQKTNRFLIAILLLQGLTLAGQWLDGARMLPSAHAEPPRVGGDPSGDRQAMIDAQRETNTKLEKLIGILEGGNLQVKVVMPDEGKGGAKR